MESKTREKLLAAAGIAVNQCLSVQPGEQVLVVTDPICRSIAEALYEAAVQVRAEALLLMETTAVSSVVSVRLCRL